MKKSKLAAIIAFISSLSMQAKPTSLESYDLTLQEQDMLTQLAVAGAIRVNKDGTALELAPELTEVLIENGNVGSEFGIENRMCSRTYGVSKIHIK